VQKIFNLACGSFYALGAYVGVSAVSWYTSAGGPAALFVLPLALAGLAVGAIGFVVERGLLRFVYDRDEAFQLLLTFAVVLMMEDAIRLTWGTSPQSTSALYLTYGQVRVLGATAPVYNLIVIAASLVIALLIGGLLTRTTFGRTIAEHGVTRHWIAESRMEIDQARLLTLHAARMMDEVGNKAARAEIAMIKVVAPNMAGKVIDRAIQVCGGAGVCQDFHLAYAYARTRVIRLADGPDEVHRETVAKLELGKYTNKPAG